MIDSPTNAIEPQMHYHIFCISNPHNVSHKGHGGHGTRICMILVSGEKCGCIQNLAKNKAMFKIKGFLGGNWEHLNVKYLMVHPLVAPQNQHFWQGLRPRRHGTANHWHCSLKYVTPP